MAIVDQGLRVFPCHSGGTKPKAPMVNNWPSVASSDGQVAVSQWARTPGAAIGLPTGSAQKLADGMKLLVLDLDKKPDGDGWDSLREITKQIGSLPATLTVSTPSGGHHLYFKIPGDAKVTISASALGKYIDVRCDGGYVIAPGSELIGKGRYEIVTQRQPVAELPRAWLDRLTSRGKRQRLNTGRTARALPEISNETAHGLAVVGEVKRELSNAFPGQRNDQLNASAFKLGILVAQGHLKKETAFDALIEGAITNGLFQEDEDSAHRTIESGLEAGIEEGREESAEALTTLTEDSLALLFADRFEGKFLHDHTRAAWFQWDGSCWRHDNKQSALMASRELIRAETAGMKGTAPLNKVSAARAILAGAAADPKLAITHEDWNRDPWLLGAPGGIVDLKTGALLPPDPAKRINAQTLVAPAEPGTPMPRWKKFLHEVTQGDKELQRYLQQIAGYCLTGSTTEEAFFFIHGPGGNGKGVFIGALGAIMQDYGRSAPMQTFMASKNDRHLTELARLLDARLVTASETEEGRQLALARIKELTGNERPIAANFMRKDHFEFVPQFKLVLTGNDKPKIPSVDDAIRRRMRLVPFTFKPAEIDPELKDKLKAEYSAILRWAIEGCLDWQQNGFVEPKVVREATDDYLEEEDVRSQWLEERTIKERGAFTMTADLYADWQRWAASHNHAVGAPNDFGRWLAKQGLKPGKKKGRGFLDIRLIPSEMDGWDR